MSTAHEFVHVEDRMSYPAGYPPFRYDSRGNRLESWITTEAQGGHMLWLRGPVEVARQVQAFAPQYQGLALSMDATIKGWTHVLFSPEPSVSQSVRLMLDLLKQIVSVPSQSGIDFAFALDWYKNPVDGIDSYSWPNTEVGELVNSGKYRYRQQAGPQAIAGRALAGRFCDVIRRHGLLRGAAIILDVPGHDSSRVSFGSRLAATVARDMDLPMSRVGARSSFRPESKAFGGAQLAELLADEFVVSDDVRGRPVLIVDDVIRSGVSMAAVGRAARTSGARTVLGICAARTNQVELVVHVVTKVRFSGR